MCSPCSAEADMAWLIWTNWLCYWMQMIGANGPEFNTPLDVNLIILLSAGGKCMILIVCNCFLLNEKRAQARSQKIIARVGSWSRSKEKHRNTAMLVPHCLCDKKTSLSAQPNIQLRTRPSKGNTIFPLFFCITTPQSNSSLWTLNRLSVKIWEITEGPQCDRVLSLRLL